MPLLLSEISLPDQPTESQIKNAFSDLNKFISKIMGAVMAAGEGTASDQRIALALNAATQLQQSGLMFGSLSNIAIPEIAVRPQ